ncbi:hypothetical protein [Arthrobacter bussei]|uniref:Uncharacterized protein n=1 Tax=Arthrobacter bussei TaxID=2594179 RepID=A0A7X1NSN7_9MICC|nr:hypothetical protein [Arthrobacter bussei]MPY12095.1 hypothetical protein [Arthrobacter bussei]
MDRNEKKRLRERIGEKIDVSGTRMSDDEATFLAGVIDKYDEQYRGDSSTKTSSFTGSSSEGKYTRTETWTHTFTDEVGIRQDYEYHDDDGQTGKDSKVIKDARGILNWFQGRP